MDVPYLRDSFGMYFLQPSGALKIAYSFRFEFRRIDEFATNLCPTRNLGGKVIRKLVLTNAL